MKTTYWKPPTLIGWNFWMSECAFATSFQNGWRSSTRRPDKSVPLV